MLFHFIFEQSFTSLDGVTGSFWFVGDLVLLQSCPTRFVPGARHKGWDQIIKNGAANSPHLKLSIPDVKGCLFRSSFTIRSSDPCHETSAPPNVVVCNCKDAIRLHRNSETRWRPSVIDTWNGFMEQNMILPLVNVGLDRQPDRVVRRGGLSSTYIRRYI